MRKKTKDFRAKTYNSHASVYVKLVSFKNPKKTVCPHSVAMFGCKDLATHKAVLGSHISITCEDEDHIENAMLEVAQDFVDEMIDLYGNTPEWRSGK